MDKILVIGANGFLGRKLLYHLRSLEISSIGADLDIRGISPEFSPTILDITAEQHVQKVISKIHPTIVILTAAMTNVDACEEQPALAQKINTYGPLFVARASKAVDAALLHISTDFIFDGHTGNYHEDDPPNPLSVYGQSKLDGERYILALDFPSLICRTSVLYGWPAPDQRDNFFSWAFKQLQQNNSMKIVDGQITTPTLVENLAESLVQLSIHQSWREHHVLHTAGPESISRYQFVSKLMPIFHFKPELLVKIPSLTQKAIRPENSSLNTSRLQSLLPGTFLGIDASLTFLSQHKPFP